MREYFLGLIAFAFFGAVILSLAPSGTPRRYLRLLCGLCSIGCIALPIFDIASGEGVSAESFAAIFDADREIDGANVEIYNLAINSASVDNAELALKERISAELDSDYDAIDVEISLAESTAGAYIERIWIYIYPSGIALDPARIESTVGEVFDAPCEFVYRGK